MEDKDIMASAQEYQSAKPGDLIEISHGIYSHWAVYIGDGEVVHFGSTGCYDDLIMRPETVRREKLSDVVGSHRFKINNQLDNKYKPYPGPDIVKRALDMVDKVDRYSIAINNCEHFATRLRYGKAKSEQVTRVAIGATAVLFVSLLYLAVIYWLVKSKNKEEEPQPC